MNAGTRHGTVAGPEGLLVTALDEPAGPPVGLALLCHPHPLHGGTMDNKVVQTLARACVAMGYTALRHGTKGGARSTTRRRCCRRTAPMDSRCW